MRFTALQSTGMHTAIPSSGANAVGIGLAARPALPSCRGPHDLPDAPLSVHLNHWWTLSGLSPRPSRHAYFTKAINAVDRQALLVNRREGFCQTLKEAVTIAH